MPQTLTQIKALLEARGLRPKHRFGQNFLHDQNKIRQIIHAAEIDTHDVVLEVGPGTGTLSLAMLDAGAMLVAVEIDHDLCDVLREVFAPFADRVSLIEGDVLHGKHALNESVTDALCLAMKGKSSSTSAVEAVNQQQRRSTFKLIANLPYNIASPLLVNLALDHPAMDAAIIMIQREVADRLVADAGGKDYGPLGIIMQAICKVERVTTLPPECFWPRPKVNSAVIKVTRRAKPLTDDPHAFAAFVHRLFQHRRKQVRAVVEVDGCLPAFDWFDPAMRAEAFSVQQLIDLAAWHRLQSTL